MSKPPKQKPGNSEQIVCTPDDFLTALRNKFGEIAFDLAADKDNAVAPAFYGPGSDLAEDALNVTWPKESLCFLNPPFGMIKGKHGFAAKAAAEMHKGSNILMLVPAAVGSNWFRDHVFTQATVYFLNPRLTFKGHLQSYPKDLILCHFNNHAHRLYSIWQWK